MNNSIWMTIPYGKINGKYDNIKIMPTHQQNNNQPRHARRRGNKAYGNWKLGQNLSGYKDIRDGMGWWGNKKLHIKEGEITWKELAHLPKPTINYSD